MEDMKGKKIAVVVGGPSTEAEVSRRTGAAIAEALKKKGYATETIELVPHALAATLKEKENRRRIQRPSRPLRRRRCSPRPVRNDGHPLYRSWCHGQCRRHE